MLRGVAPNQLSSRHGISLRRKLFAVDFDGEFCRRGSKKKLKRFMTHLWFWIPSRKRHNNLVERLDSGCLVAVSSRRHRQLLLLKKWLPVNYMLPERKKVKVLKLG